VAEIPVLVSVMMGDPVDGDHSIVELVRDLRAKVCAQAHDAAVAAGLRIGKGCHYQSFATEVNDDVDGGRAEFLSTLESSNIGDAFLSVYVAMWDHATRPVAIVHFLERVD
jgi:hypothetical protein